MTEYLKLLGLILLVYLAVYSIISRVCDCIERRAYAKHGVLRLDVATEQRDLG